MEQSTGIGEVLRRAAGIYRARFRHFMVPVLAVNLPLIILAWGWMAAFGALFLNAYPARNSFPLLLLLAVLYIPLLGGALLLTPPAAYAQIASMLRGMRGGEALSAAFSRYGRALGSYYLAGIVATGCVAGVYCAFLFSATAGSVLGGVLRLGLWGGAGYIVATVVTVMMVTVGVLALTTVGGTLVATTLPASVALDLTPVKALRYSVAHCRRTFAPGFGAIGVSMLALFVLNIAIVAPPILASHLIGGWGSFAFLSPLFCLGLLYILNIMAAPFFSAIQCALFEITSNQPQG